MGGTTSLFTVIAGIFSASAVALGVLAGRHFNRRLAFVRTSAAAPGVIVALREDRDGMDPQSVRYPKVRFRTASGREITFESGIARGGDAWRVGEAVLVRYQLDHPEIAEFDTFAVLWGPTLVFALLAAVFAGVSAGLWLGLIP